MFNVVLCKVKLGHHSIVAPGSGIPSQFVFIEQPDHTQVHGVLVQLFKHIESALYLWVRFEPAHQGVKPLSLVFGHVIVGSGTSREQTLLRLPPTCLERLLEGRLESKVLIERRLELSGGGSSTENEAVGSPE